MTYGFLAILRLLIGFIQGIVLYGLFRLGIPGSGLVLDPLISQPLSVVMVYIPLIIIQGAGNVRWKVLLIWSAVAAVLLWVLTDYSIWRCWTPVSSQCGISFELIVYTIIALFITHCLVTAGDINRRFMAHYAIYFDVAWKLAVQIVLAVVFVGIFWLLLYLGACLFHLIGHDFFANMVFKFWFLIPATTLAISAAFQVTDVQVQLVRGMRFLILTLLSWLLPLMTLILAGFLLILLVPGSTTLWHNRNAVIALFITAAILVLLINSVYQDGSCEQTIPRILRYSASLAALLLIPLTVICIYFLYLRVAQYGWTDYRIIAAAYLVIVSAYALSYSVAVFYPGRWLKSIEYSNFGIAWLILLIMTALMTPIADPARWSVASLVARLHAGQIQPDQFDFSYLHWRGQRFGQQALLQLQQYPQAPQLLPGRYSDTMRTQTAAIVIHTADGRLPESFLIDKKWQYNDAPWEIPSCLSRGDELCDAWMMDLDHSGRREIIILQQYRFTGFVENSPGTWAVVGTWDIPVNFNANDKIARKTAQAGQFQLTPSQQPQAWPDLLLMGERLPFKPHSHPASASH